METKHTPGPWVLIDGDWFEKDKVITTQSRLNESMYGICEMDVYFDDDQNGEEQEANARLIASAPELLEALKALSNYDNLGAYERARKKARAAIAQATGA